MAFVWSHSHDKASSPTYWASLKGMHTFIYLLAFVELAVKIVIEYFAMQMNKQIMKENFSVKNLFTLNYKEDANKLQEMTDTNRKEDYSSYRNKYGELQ